MARMRALLVLFAALALPVWAGGTMNIVLLENEYRVEERQFVQKADLLKFVQERQPALVQILVCVSTRDKTLVSLEKAIQSAHRVELRVGRLPKKAVECSQHLSNRVRAS